MTDSKSAIESKSNTMLAVRKTQSKAGFELVRVPIPRPKDNEVLLKVLACSLCGTDIHVYNWDAPFCNGRLTPPVTTGHEVCGEVVAVGKEVSTLSIGDLVSAESHIPCKAQPSRGEKNLCYMCQTGNEHICEFVKFFSVDVDGFLAEYAVAPACMLWKNDKTMRHDLAALQESLGNSVYTVDESKVSGKDVAVFGLGPTGLNAIAVCKAMGAKKIIAVAGTDAHCELAKKMGATHVLNRHKVEPVVEIRKLTDGHGPHVCLEMSGHSEALAQCCDAVMTTGQITILGLYPTSVQLDWSKKIILKDLTVRGIYGRKIWSTWKLTSKLLAEGMDISSVITHRFEGLKEFEKGVSAMKKGECGKCVFFPHGSLWKAPTTTTTTVFSSSSSASSSSPSSTASVKI
eukprot:TRINITY_DN1656_c0_g1_i1.p1 TRINITY_DN1656_c0_g1~~TRINITY_DN1656_c0_g1_i1.p1  ORF type:complete len:409 (-),score=101.39 TRINITY_DN1656_c0_g1_i1:127-1332(-)